MATYKLKRKTFAIFNQTRQAFAGVGKALQDGGWKTGSGLWDATKQAGKGLAHGTAGVGKFALGTAGVAAGASLLGAGAIANEMDKPNR